MQYINPIEILQLSNMADSSQIDSDTIKKAKRRLFADIDLDKPLQNGPPRPSETVPFYQRKVIPFGQSKVSPFDQGKVIP
jgi:hypothetical protein